MVKAAESVPGRGAQKLINLGYVVCDALATGVLFQATARLAVERETYGEGRPASFHMWESMARHMIESLDCDGAFAKRIDAERMARMLTGALLGLHLTWQATGHEQGLHEEVEYFWRTIAPVLIAPLRVRGPRTEPSGLSARRGKLAR